MLCYVSRWTDFQTNFCLYAVLLQAEILKRGIYVFFKFLVSSAFVWFTVHFALSGWSVHTECRAQELQRLVVKSKRLWYHGTRASEVLQRFDPFVSVKQQNSLLDDNPPRLWSTQSFCLHEPVHKMYMKLQNSQAFQYQKVWSNSLSTNRYIHSATNRPVRMFYFFKENSYMKFLQRLHILLKCRSTLLIIFSEWGEWDRFVKMINS